MDNQAALERYAEIKKSISELEKELDEIKASVFESVEASKGVIENDTFVLKTQKRPKYKFSEAYESKNSELKELRKKEIDDGTATIDGYSEFVTVKFKD